MQIVSDITRISLQRFKEKDVRCASLRTPIGMVLVSVSDYGVCNVSVIDNSNTEFLKRSLWSTSVFQGNDCAVEDVIYELNEYFFGARQHFTVAVDLRVVTEFTLRVLRVTQSIRFGEVLSYSDVARKIGSPKACRAVGRALSRNPVPIIVPCHRVVSHGGCLGGFTLGRLSKSTLLQLEGHTKLKK